MPRGTGLKQLTCLDARYKIKQHLIINSGGQVQFSSLNFGYGMVEYRKGGTL